MQEPFGCCPRNALEETSISRPRLDCEVIGLNVQEDQLHFVGVGVTQTSVLGLMSVLEGRTAVLQIASKLNAICQRG